MVTALSTGAPVPLLRNRQFIALWLSSSSSFVALSAYLIFEQWYVLKALGLTAGLGVVLIATTGPRVALMIVGGTVADRFRRSRVAATAAVARLMLVLAMLAALLGDRLSFPAVIAFAVAYGICDAFFSPANNSIAPLVVPPSQLKSANGMLQSSNQLGLVGGPLIGAAALALSYEAGLLLVSLLLLISAVAAFCVRERAATSSQNSQSVWRDLKQSATYLTVQRDLASSLITIVIINFFFFGPLLLGVPLLVANGLGGGGAGDLGLLQGSYAAGMILGAISAAVFAIREGATVVRLLIVLLGASLAGIGATHHFVLTAALMAGMGIISSLINVLIITRIQTLTPENMTGRIMSLVSVASSGLVPVSYAVLGVLISFGLSIGVLMTAAGVTISLLSIGFLLNQRRRQVNQNT